MTAAVKGAAKFVTAAASSSLYGNVSGEFHGLAAEAVPGVIVIQHFTEVDPVVTCIDEVGT